MPIGHALHRDQLELHSVTEMFYSGQSKQKGSFIPEVSFQIYERIFDNLKVKLL